ncbi:MAG: hypothetical protein EB140_01905, partial [Proteobacteria bacterium]|nr:hypothetical protein [Pseudomonadota bacterium]
CPTSITTTAADAGIWFDGKGLYDLDGPFVKNLATFYGDSAWKLYGADGKVNITDTKEAFEGAARPDVDAKYRRLVPLSGLAADRLEASLQVVHHFTAVKSMSELTGLLLK